MSEEFAEYSGVRYGDLAVESAQSGGVQGAGGQKQGHQVNIPGSEAIWGDIGC